MSDKEFKSIEQQIAILEERGLHIPDKTAAAAFLLYNTITIVSAAIH